MKLSFLVVGSALSGLSSALEWDGPVPTKASKLRVWQGFTPRPTDAPGSERSVLEMAKAKRDYVPNNYCGFLEGQSTSVVSCSVGRTCYFYQFPASLSLYGMRGCCSAADSLNCGWALDCVASADYAASCGSSCQSDAFTLKCTKPARPYCNSYQYPDPGVLDFGCGSTSFIGYRTVSTTYAGENVPSNSLYFATGPLETVGLITRGGAFGGLSRSKTTSGLGSAATSSTSSDTKVSLLPVIIGGVVGGLVLIGIVILVFVALCLRSRRKKRNARAAAAAGSAAQPQAGTQYPPGQGPGGYQPMQQQQQLQQRQQQQPYGVPMQEQQKDPSHAGFYASHASVHKDGLSPGVKEAAPTPTLTPNAPQNTSYFGTAGAPPQLGSPSQKNERPFSAEIDGAPYGTPTPGSPLPAYARGSYIAAAGPPQPLQNKAQQLHNDSMPQNGAYQLHSEHVSPIPSAAQLESQSGAPLLNAQGQQIYEVPSMAHH